MILVIECIIACVLFTVIMAGGVLWKREAFLHEYAPAVRQRFLEKNPDYTPKSKKESTIGLIITKSLVCILFIVVLSVLVWAAGARTFMTGVLYTYIIWIVVNWYDVFVLDMGVFAHWKKIRLPGTEDMDDEYCSNAGKHIKDGFIGMGIGVPAALVCGLVIRMFG